jgi:hypothetical protein
MTDPEAVVTALQNLLITQAETVDKLIQGMSTQPGPPTKHLKKLEPPKQKLDGMQGSSFSKWKRKLDEWLMNNAAQSAEDRALTISDVIPEDICDLFLQTHAAGILAQRDNSQDKEATLMVQSGMDVLLEWLEVEYG